MKTRLGRRRFLGIVLSLAIILGVLAVSVVASVVWPQKPGSSNRESGIGKGE